MRLEYETNPHQETRYKGEISKTKTLKKEDIKEYWHKKKTSKRSNFGKEKKQCFCKKNAACLQNHEPIFTFAACVVRVSDQPCD